MNMERNLKVRNRSPEPRSRKDNIPGPLHKRATGKELSHKDKRSSAELDVVSSLLKLSSPRNSGRKSDISDLGRKYDSSTQSDRNAAYGLLMLSASGNNVLGNSSTAEESQDIRVILKNLHHDHNYAVNCFQIGHGL
ncbi:uncharacterized protein [Parasteatoda tepidariorum]|uniref:uncharacterized protein isoform X2 n=1 Tax=Parasteatoda tepidariorum TaxID=114398 RepID=UPI001C71FF79|nr:uncharacterized protein LOC107447897 isoform X2 [Parasteatoda tepidariorum]